MTRQDLISAEVKDLFAVLDNDGLILTPNHRASVQLFELYGRFRAQQGFGVICPSPRIFPVDIWVRRTWNSLRDNQPADLSALTILEPAQELFLWKSIILDSDAGGRLFSPEGTAAAALEAYRILQQWKIPVADIQAYATPGGHDDCGAFLEWLTAYQVIRREKSLLSLTELLGHFTGLLASCRLQGLKEVVLLGFDNTPPLYLDLFDAMAQTVKVSHRNLSPSIPALEKHSYPGRREELAAAATWAKSIIERNANARVGIICPDLHESSDEVTRCFANTFDPAAIHGGETDQDRLFYNTSGPRLGNLPLIETALLMLTLNEPQLPALEACQIIRSPFLLAAEEEAQSRAALEYRIRSSAEDTVRSAWLRTLAGQQDKPWFSPLLAGALGRAELLRKAARGKQDHHAWALLFESQLEALAWPKVEDQAEQSNALAGWYELLAQFRKLSLIGGPLSLRDARALIGRLARNLNAERPDRQAPVRLMTPVEAGGLRFSHLWFMGLTDNDWPPAARANPFIPLPLQKHYQIPGSTPSLQYEAARRSLDQLIGGTNDQVVLSCFRQDDDRMIGPSMLLMEHPGTFMEHKETSATHGLHPDSLALVQGATDVMELDVQPARLAVAETGSIKGGSSLVADQAACPFRAFAVHRLGARELPSLKYGLPAFAVGNMLHQAMDFLWRELRDSSRLAQLTRDGRTALVTAAVEHGIAWCKSRYPQIMQEKYSQLEGRRLRDLLLVWLEQEVSRGYFEVIAREHALQWRHADLTLELRMDRIERLNDNGIGIVDYKSGGVSRIDWLSDRQDNPQLMLYSQAVEDCGEFGAVTSLLHAQINIENIGWRGITETEEICNGLSIHRQRGMPPDLSWSELKEHWRSSLAHLAQQFLDGHIAVDPKTGSTCQYCHLGPFCRVREQEALVS